MEQRRPRLGDIVDDYCPRERRITNHAVVAMIEDAVKQTRCTTCDADHEYKQARIPAQRRKKAGASALDGHPMAESARGRMITPDSTPEDADESHAVPALDEEAAEAAVGNHSVNNGVNNGVNNALNSGVNDAVNDGVDNGANTGIEQTVEHAEAHVAEHADEPAALAAAADDEPRDPPDEGPVHRRLIRAQLPRPEGQVPERKAPDFTIRQQGQRGRFDQNGNGNTNRAGRPPQRTMRGPHSPSGGGQQRFGGPRQQGGAGGGGGQRPNGPRPAGGSGGGQQRQGRAGGGGRKRGR